MAENRITIKDLAEKMNLSVSSISRALNNHPSIGDETKKKVKKLAEELGYFPNSIASNFRQNRTYSIGIIAPRIDVYFHSLVISGIEEVMYKSGYNVMIYQSRDSSDREEAITNILQNNRVEGIIACLALETKDCSHFSKFKNLGIPVVFYDRIPNNNDFSKITINDFEAAFNATEHLISMGCKRISHIAGNQKTSIFSERLRGYKAALKKHHLKVDEDLIIYSSDLSYEEGVKSAKKLLSLTIQPDGIFCANDYTAISTMQVYLKANYKIPDDIAVVGFSNYPISRIIEPQLTTIDDRAFEMGKTAAKLLLRQIDEKNSLISSETIVLKSELIIRDSSNKKQLLNA